MAKGGDAKGGSERGHCEARQNARCPSWCLHNSSCELRVARAQNHHTHGHACARRSSAGDAAADALPPLSERVGGTPGLPRSAWRWQRILHPPRSCVHHLCQRQHDADRGRPREDRRQVLRRGGGCVPTMQAARVRRRGVRDSRPRGAAGVAPLQHSSSSTSAVPLFPLPRGSARAAGCSTPPAPRLAWSTRQHSVRRNEPQQETASASVGATPAGGAHGSSVQWRGWRQ